MQTSIALSVNKIIEVIMARSALRHILDPQRPPLLIPDQRKALGLLIENLMERLALILHAGIKSDDDVTVLTVDLPPGNNPSALRSNIEFAVASSVLAQAYSGIDSDFSDACRADSDIAHASLRAIASGSATIIPCPF